MVHGIVHFLYLPIPPYTSLYLLISPKARMVHGIVHFLARRHLFAPRDVRHPVPDLTLPSR